MINQHPALEKTGVNNYTVYFLKKCTITNKSEMFT
jgi:hypothetical protein